MCGITGLIGNNYSGKEKLEVISKMTESINYRGPDSSGEWLQKDSLVAFGHSRLSIVDLSKLGNQPMHSVTGRFTIAFNGEIYNFRNIKLELENLGHNFKSETDTEVLLSSIEEWGLDAALNKFAGMFAFSIWDEKLHELTIVRDRLGEKPIYYGWQGTSFIFASELKALKKFNEWSGIINKEALSLFLKYSYVPSPHSIYENIFKLEPGHYIKLCHKNNSWDQLVKTKWWDPDYNNRKSKMDRLEIIQEFESLLVRSVSDQMKNDVSTGIFLSAGIDSSLILAIAQNNTSNVIDAHTIGFEKFSKYDESKKAAKISNYLGVTHHSYDCSLSDVKNILPKIANIYDEPFADSSQIPSIFLAQESSRISKVCLSGDGGDEISAGYYRHIWAPIVLRWLKRNPVIINSILRGTINLIPVNLMETIYQLVISFFPKQYRTENFSNKLYKFKNLLSSQSEYEIYKTLLINGHNRNIVRGHLETSSCSDIKLFNSYGKNYLDRILKHDLLHYLPDDIFTKIDRASMSSSLETRAPFADHRIIDFISSIPANELTANNVGKSISKELLKKYLPNSITDMPKTGFGVPLDYWLKKDLKGWATDLLSPESIKRQGYLDNDIVQGAWQSFSNNQLKPHHEIWNILVWQSWVNSQ